MVVKCEIKEAQESDVRKGWIRLNHKLRGTYIELEGIYKISKGKNSVYRMVLGNDNLKPVETGIFMDFNTRKELNATVNETVSLNFEKLNWWGRWFCYNWWHPDFAFKSAYRVGMVLGLGGLLTSIILGIISIILTNR